MDKNENDFLAESEPELTKEEEDDLMEAFSLFDNDGDEHIGPEELQSVMLAIGKMFTIPDIEKLIARIKLTDLSGNKKERDPKDEHPEELN